VSGSVTALSLHLNCITDREGNIEACDLGKFIRSINDAGHAPKEPETRKLHPSVAALRK